MTFSPISLPDLLATAAQRHSASVALDFLGRRFRYRELHALSQRAAQGFLRLGLGRGRRIGLFLPNTPHYVIAYYGALSAGATVVNFSPLYAAEEIVRQSQDSDTDAIVCLDIERLFAPLRQAMQAGGVHRVIVGSMSDVLPQPKALAYRALKQGERASIAFDDRHISFRHLLQSDGAPDPPMIDPAQEVALIQYTGGTTGTPKGAALTHANLTINAQQILSIDPDKDRRQSVLGVLPLFHIFANTCVLNRTILNGGEIVMLPKFEASEALQAIAQKKVTDFVGVPAMFQALIDHQKFARTDLSSLRRAFSGGAAMSDVLRRRFEAATGVPVIDGYGLTESAGVLTAKPFNGTGPAGSVGQALPQTVIKIVSPDDPSVELPAGQQGEVIAGGPQIMLGYWRKDTKRVETLSGGVLRTGDIGRLDEEGYLMIVDRLKDMINVAGFKVFPSQLEAVLHTHPAVREAAVIGVPDARLGERPKAFVVIRPGAHVTSRELLDHLNAQVSKYARTQDLEFRDQLPKTLIGKPSRKTLVAEESARAVPVESPSPQP